MRRSETNLVISGWKGKLEDERHEARWGRFMAYSDFFALANYVVPRITLPSCIVYVGCYEDEPDNPVCWVALRKPPSLPEHRVVYLYARPRLREDPELAATLERELLSRVSRECVLSPTRPPYNPFNELRRL